MLKVVLTLIAGSKLAEFVVAGVDVLVLELEAFSLSLRLKSLTLEAKSFPFGVCPVFFFGFITCFPRNPLIPISFNGAFGEGLRPLEPAAVDFSDSGLTFLGTPGIVPDFPSKCLKVSDEMNLKNS